jgi:hypothetical protein
MTGAMLPRMHVLSRLDTNQDSSISMHFGVLDGDKRGARVVHPTENIGVMHGLLPSVGVSVEPSHPRVGEVGTRRVSYDEVPSQIHDVGGVSLEVGDFGGICGFKVAGSDLNTNTGKHISDYTMRFSYNEYSRRPGSQPSPG